MPVSQRALLSRASLLQLSILRGASSKSLSASRAKRFQINVITHHLKNEMIECEFQAS